MNFQNDAALDFQDELLERPWADTIRLALLALTRGVSEGAHFKQRELEQYCQCCAALAAAEVVAAAIGKPSSDFPEELQPVIESLVLNKDAGTRKLARQAVRNVLKKSELRNLWADMGENVLSEWETIQRDLLLRLK